VYNVADVTKPVLKQALPTCYAPHGLQAIPSRNLLVSSCSVDAREDGYRAGISIYELQEGSSNYPTLVSIDREDGTPIPFGSLSGLAAVNDSMLHAMADSEFRKNAILHIDVSAFPAKVVGELRIYDTNGVLAAAFDSNVNISFINDDQTVNLDTEGLCISSRGGYWLVHEGGGTVGDVDHPVTSPNAVLKVSENGVIEKVIFLPEYLNEVQMRYGLKGVAEDGDMVVVVLHIPWDGEDNSRIGIYNQETETWKFLFFPTDKPESQMGGYVGLSDIEARGNGIFYISERDSAGGPDAVIKRVYQVDLGDFSLEDGTLVTKTLVRDLMPDLAAAHGNIPVKIAGMTSTPNGDIWIVNDNDNAKQAAGEMRFIRIDMSSAPSTLSFVTLLLLTAMVWLALI
jgi:hypothetical protein